MSNGKQETIADIVAALRTVAYIQTAESPSSVLGFANRIEAAANHQFRDTTKMIPEEMAVSKMETTTPTCSKSLQVGNADCSAYENRVVVNFPYGERHELCIKCARELFPENKESEVKR